MNQITVDVGVIAAGPAGLTAAVAAAENGASVAVFEKSKTTGGVANMAMGPFGVESTLQKKQIIGLTRDEAFRIHMDYNHWLVDARLVRAFIDKSGDTIDWLMNMGVKFVLAARHFPLSSPTWHLLDASTAAHGSARAIYTALTDKATELGVKFYFSSPAKKILKKDGKVIGFTALDETTGETVQVNAKATVVATGGFGANAGMIKKYTGFDWGKNLFSFAIPGIDGDGIRMAWEAGAASTHMIIEMYCAVPRQDEFWNVDALFRQPNLLVNLNGERFFNEELFQNNTFAGNAISRQKNSCAFMIFDEEAHRYYLKNGFDQICYDIPVEDARDFDREAQRGHRQWERGFLCRRYHRGARREDRHELTEPQENHRSLQQCLRDPGRPLQQELQVYETGQGPEVLRRQARAERLRELRRHQGQLQDGSARQGVQPHPGLLCRGDGCQLHPCRQLHLHHAGKLHGLRLEQRQDRR